MNKITHDGQEYEVLPLDRISEITHAMVSSGAVFGASPELEENTELHSVYINYEIGASDELWASSMNTLGIQPLKLLPKVPVEFVATFAFTGVDWRPLYCLADGLSMQGREQKKFRCVEVTE